MRTMILMSGLGSLLFGRLHGALSQAVFGILESLGKAGNQLLIKEISIETADHIRHGPLG